MSTRKFVYCQFPRCGKYAKVGRFCYNHIAIGYLKKLFGLPAIAIGYLKKLFGLPARNNTAFLEQAAKDGDRDRVQRLLTTCRDQLIIQRAIKLANKGKWHAVAKDLQEALNRLSAEQKTEHTSGEHSGMSRCRYFRCPKCRAVMDKSSSLGGWATNLVIAAKRTLITGSRTCVCGYRMAAMDIYSGTYDLPREDWRKYPGPIEVDDEMAYRLMEENVQKEKSSAAKEQPKSREAKPIQHKSSEDQYEMTTEEIGATVKNVPFGLFFFNSKDQGITDNYAWHGKRAIRDRIAKLDSCVLDPSYEVFSGDMLPLPAVVHNIQLILSGDHGNLNNARWLDSDLRHKLANGSYPTFIPYIVGVFAVSSSALTRTDECLKRDKVAGYLGLIAFVAEDLNLVMGMGNALALPLHSIHSR